MMGYITIEQLALYTSWDEIAQASAPRDVSVDGDALKAAVAGSQDNAAAIAALARISSLIQAAGDEIKAYIPPSTSAQIIPHTHTASIVLYRLYGGEPDSERRQRYDDALAYLQAVSRGDIVQDEATGEPGDVRYDSPPPVFTDEVLSGY